MLVTSRRPRSSIKDTLALREVLIQLPKADDVGALHGRLAHHGNAVANTGAELLFADP